MSNSNETRLKVEQPKPTYRKVWFVTLALIMATPLGIVLWFKFFKRPHGFIKALVSFVLLFFWVAFVVATIQVSMNYEPPTTKHVGEAQQVQRQTPTPTPTPTATPAPATPTKQTQIGQTFSDAGFNFTVNSLKCGEKEIGFSYSFVNYSTDAQGQYCRLNVKITNIGNSVNSTNAYSQYVFNSQGQRYDYDSSATGYAARYYFGNPFSEDINPGNSITGDIVFDVPVGVTPTTAELHGESDSLGVRIDLQ